jgi:hypothetical protein
VPDTFDSPKSVEFIRGRWDVTVCVVDRFDCERFFMASADSYFTEGSGIYFAEVDGNGEPIKEI